MKNGDKNTPGYIDDFIYFQPNNKYPEVCHLNLETPCI